MSTLLDAVDHRRFLHDARDRAELTNKQLAAAIARSPSWLSQMLAGQRPFDPTLVEAFTTTLGLAPEERAAIERDMSGDERVGPRPREADEYPSSDDEVVHLAEVVQAGGLEEEVPDEAAVAQYLRALKSCPAWAGSHTIFTSADESISGFGLSEAARLQTFLDAVKQAAREEKDRRR